MNNLEYLDSISANAAQPTSSTPISQNLVQKIFFFVLGVVFLITIILFIVVALTPSNSSLPTDLSRIYLRSTSLSETLQEYSPKIGSSSLRSTTSMLNTSLSSLSTNLSTILEADYSIDATDLTLSTEDEKSLTELATNLETGRLNGILDRTLARELSYHTSLLIILIDAALAKLPDSSQVKTSLTSSRASLSQLQTTFSNFSDTPAPTYDPNT